MENQQQLVSPVIQHNSHQNQPIQQSIWSAQLKSDLIDVNDNVARLKESPCYYQYCLLNEPFSHTIDAKQSYELKINKKIGGMYVGIFLKNKLVSSQFSSKKITYGKNGHGMNMIGAGGDNFSHSEDDLKIKRRSFRFEDGDVVFIQYDPIDNKLRFINRNSEAYFQFEIIPPPQNDAYHLCAALWGVNTSAEVISRNQSNKLNVE